MISNGKALIDFIDAILNKHGFVKKKDTWYKHTEDCICFFTMGKSPYGGYYDHAFGFFLKDINKTGKEFPIFYKCDLKINLQFFADYELVKRVLNLENREFKAVEREFLITEMFDLYVIPFLNDVGSKDGVKAAMNKYNNLIYYLKGDAMRYLKLDHPDD